MKKIIPILIIFLLLGFFFWITKIENRKNLLAGSFTELLVTINPPVTDNSEFDFNLKSYGNQTFIYIGKLKSTILDTNQKYNKNQYYFQLNDKIGQIDDIIPFLLCGHCDMKKRIVLMEADKNTPKELLTKIESEMFKISIKKENIYYLNINTSEFTSGYNHHF